jgi:NAD(P)-dependent dehydrogenase (short-subunit alcohol dehydrogenase family)
MDLYGKSIVIRGAAQGLGRKMAATIVRQRAKVALVDMDDAKLQEPLLRR